MRELDALLSFLKRQGKKLDDQLVASALSLLKGEQSKGSAVNVVINLLMGESRKARPVPKVSQPEDDILAQAVQSPAMKKFVDKTASV